MKPPTKSVYTNCSESPSPGLQFAYLASVGQVWSRMNTSQLTGTFQAHFQLLPLQLSHIPMGKSICSGPIRSLRQGWILRRSGIGLEGQFARQLPSSSGSSCSGGGCRPFDQPKALAGQMCPWQRLASPADWVRFTEGLHGSEAHAHLAFKNLLQTTG